jgi:integrase/recombinase XerD
VVREEGRAPAMRLLDVCLIGALAQPGGPSVRLGVPLLDEYLRFLSGRCRPNTVLASAYDLKVFFTVSANNHVMCGRPTCSRS